MPTSHERASRLGRVVAVVSLSVGFLFLDGQLGPMTFPLRRVGAAVLLVVATLASGRPRGIRLPLALATCAMVALVTMAPTVLLALLGYALVVALVSAGQRSSGGHFVPGLAQALLVYVGIEFLPDLIPQLRGIATIFTNATHAYLRATTGSEHLLSPTATGGPAIVLLAVFLAWRWRLSGSRLRLFAALGLPLLWFFLLAPLALPGSAGPLSIFTRGAIHGVCWLAIAVLIDAIVPSTEENRLPTAPMSASPFPIFAGMTALLMGVTLVGVAGPIGPKGRSILVHNRGGLDWDRPVFGKFGAFSGGMFGLFPVYARGNGYRFDVLNRDTIRSSDLSHHQILVLINSPKAWGGSELRAVRDFVARGGSLLVLGDHTDVFGLMRGFNSLLADFGIRFRFDSAYHARHTWRGCVAGAPDAVATGWSLESPNIGIGASLALSGWSRPLLNGRYSHSDHGYRENVVGSYLGNYKYEDGEKLGDMTLIATATLGKGRVVVLGDTTPFQGNFDYSFASTVGPLLELLSRPTNFLDRPGVRAFVAVSMIVVLLVAWLQGAGVQLTTAVLATFLLGVAGGWISSELRLRSTLNIASDCFLMDRSHLPAVGHYDAKVNPSGPLETNLLRCGLRVANFDTWDRAMLSKSRGIAFIAPQRLLSKSEVDDLLKFEIEGGVVLVATGQPDSAAVRPLLLAHDLDLASRPLGSIPNATDQALERGFKGRELPHFLDAWPIVGAKGVAPDSIPGVEVIYRAERDVLALFQRRGRGGLMLFADARFFSSMNMEDISGYSLGNIALIHDVFQKYLGVTSNRVRPLFPSPTKPE